MDSDVKFKRIQCLDRAMDIVSLVCRSSGLTMNEIAEGMELKVGTVYNIVKTLSSRGFLANNNGRYTVGASLGLIASTWDVQNSLPQVIRPITEAIAKRVGDGNEVSVTVMVDGKPEIISCEKGGREIEYKQFIHTTWNFPLYLSTGRILVAFANEPHWDDYIQNHLEKGPITEDEKKWGYREWYEMLMQVRADGYSIISSRLPIHGAKRSVGVPLFNPAGALIAAIGITCDTEYCFDEHLNKVKDIALDVIKNNPLF